MKRNVKSGMLAAALFGAIAAGTANAGVVMFDPTGSGVFDPMANPATFQLDDIDWVSNTAVSQDVTSPLLVGTTFDTFAHSRASAFNGGSTAVPDLNPDPMIKSELTFVTGFQSKVTAAAIIPGVLATAQFQLAGPSLKNGNGSNFFEIYWDAPGESISPISNDFDVQDIAGSPEFRDGVLILSGSIVSERTLFNQILALPLVPLGPNDPDAVDSPLNPIPTVQGSGAIFELTADIDFIDPLYLNVINMPGFIKLLITDGNLRDPFLQAEPSVAIYDGAADVAVVPGVPNGGFGVTGDFVFEHDSATIFEQFEDIPEPATAALGLMGLAGLAFGRRRKA